MGQRPPAGPGPQAPGHVLGHVPASRTAGRRGCRRAATTVGARLPRPPGPEARLPRLPVALLLCSSRRVRASCHPGAAAPGVAAGRPPRTEARLPGPRPCAAGTGGGGPASRGPGTVARQASTAAGCAWPCRRPVRAGCPRLQPWPGGTPGQPEPQPYHRQPPGGTGCGPRRQALPPGRASPRYHRAAALWCGGLGHAGLAR